MIRVLLRMKWDVGDDETRGKASLWIIVAERGEEDPSCPDYCVSQSKYVVQL